MASVKRNIIANFLGNGWTAVVSLLFVPVFIRYLGIEAYGLIGVFVALEQILLLLDMGITPTLNREMARFTAGVHSLQAISNLLRSLEVIVFAVAALIASGFWAVSDLLASYWLQADTLTPETMRRAIIIMGVIFALRFIDGVYRGALFGLQEQVWCNAVSAALVTLRYVGSVAILIWISPTVEAFFLWHLTVAALSVVVFAVAVHRALPVPPARPQASRNALAGVSRFAGGMMGITFLALMLTQTDKILLSTLLPLEAFGYYALAATVAGVIRRLTGPLTQAIYPRMVEVVAQNEESTLVSIYHEGAQLVTVLTAPAAMLLLFFGEGVLYMWSGDVDLAARTAPVLAPLALGTFFNGLMWMPYQLQLAHGWTRLALFSNAVAVLLLIPALVWVAPRYGAEGAAWVWVWLNVGYLLLTVPLMHRRFILQEKWRWYGADVLVPTIGVSGVMLLATLLAPVGPENRWQWFGFLMVTGGAASATAVVLASRVRSRLVNLRETVASL